MQACITGIYKRQRIIGAIGMGNGLGPIGPGLSGGGPIGGGPIGSGRIGPRQNPRQALGTNLFSQHLTTGATVRYVDKVFVLFTGNQFNVF